MSSWIIVGIVGWLCAVACLLALLKAGAIQDEERAAAWERERELNADDTPELSGVFGGRRASETVATTAAGGGGIGGTE